MAWAKVDDGWWCHPKVMGLSPAARGVWVSVLSWSCQQRSPRVPGHLLAMVGGSNDEANALASAGLWEVDGDGWVIHDWADYQDRSLSEKRADAGRKGGKRSGQTRRSEATERSNGEANAEAGSHPVPTRPDPPLSSQSAPPPDPPGPAEDETDAPQTRHGRAVAACDLVGERDHHAATARGDVRSPASHLAACQRSARTDHLDQAQQLAHQHPDWTPDQLARALAAPPVERQTVPLEQSKHPAIAGPRPPDDDAPVASPDVVADRAAAARAALRTPGAA